MAIENPKILSFIGPAEADAPEAPFAITDDSAISLLLGPITTETSSAKGYLRVNRDGFRLLFQQRDTGLWLTTQFCPAAALGVSEPRRQPRDLDEVAWILAVLGIMPDGQTRQLLKSLPFTAEEACQDIVSPRSERSAAYLPKPVQQLREESKTLAYA